MSYVFLAIVVVMVTFQEVAKKQYTVTEQKPNLFFFSAITCFCAMLFFVGTALFRKGQALPMAGYGVENGIELLRMQFTLPVLKYSIWFGIAFVMAQVGAFLAIKWGSMAISLLILSYSLVVPTFFGIFVYQESLGIAGIIGLILLFVSIFLICDRKEKAIFSWKWLFSLVLLFLGNGFCSTIQKMQQVAFSGGFKHEFMIMALIFCTLFQFAMALVTKENIRHKLSFSLPWGALSGFANGLVNLLVMVLTASIPNAILFPTISAGGIVLGFLMAVFYYKEKLSTVQLIGYAIGTVSVVLLNL